MDMEEKYLHSMESIPLCKIVRDEYRAYQIYTLMDRAIPYLQDGLKPGQRRILYTLYKNQSKGLMKVSSATGLVLTLHPHGPASIESAIVNMAQDYTFSNNYNLIDKKGYFGERMETQPAASRYIECKLGKVAQILLFDDLEQVDMVPNYDEKVMEPVSFYPKLPLMLLNGAEGIGTGFSSVIPGFHHKDLVDSIINCVETGVPKKLRPFYHNYQHKLEIEKSGRIIFPTKIEKIGDKFFITEVPKGYDAAKIYRHLNKFIDKGDLKDYIDSSVNNEIKIELIFKRGQEITLEEIEKTMSVTSSLVPNYTLISERGVKIFDNPEDIIKIFTQKRIEVVHRRYVLLAQNYEEKIKQNNDIIRFIKEKHYHKATVSANRKSFVEYLTSKKFTFCDYLAYMPIYRMTKEEVAKRIQMVKEDSKALIDCTKIFKSPKLVEKKLIEELVDVKEQLSQWLVDREKEKNKLLKSLEKGINKKKKGLPQ